MCAKMDAQMEEYEIACCVHGYYVYREIWEAAVGETLICEREPQNGKDRYAVAVKKNETIVGHLPRKISKLCSLFLRRGASITCIVTGRRRYSVDLPQGGLEIPCRLILKANSREIDKLKRLIHH